MCKISKSDWGLCGQNCGNSRIKLLDDRKIYLGYQVEKKDSDRWYGLVADREYLLVCEYGCNGEDPEIILLKKRN